MKSILLPAFLLVHSLFTSAQADFEGMIRYKASPKKDFSKTEKKKDSLELTIFFSPGKMRIKIAETGDKEDVLVLIDSAKSYTLDYRSKTYRVKKLKEMKSPEAALPLTIAGYHCSPVQLNSLLPFGTANTTLWFADSLFFRVPEKYEGNDELLMIRKGHIMLKAIIRENDYPRRYQDHDTVSTDPDEYVFTLTATEIIPGAVQPDQFLVPADFTKSEYSYFDADSVVVDMDSLAPEIDTVIQKPVPANPVNPVKKNPSAPKKQAPTGSKSTGTPIRKEN